MSPSRTRASAFILVVAVAVGVAVVYLLVAARAGGGPAATSSSTSQPTSGRADLAAPGGYIAFRRTANDAGYGSVGTVPYDEPGSVPTSHPGLSCERIHLSRHGGVCIEVDRAAVTTARVLLLEPDLTVRHTLSTPGIPSRARVSPDGRWAATTTFVFGHSYAGGSFSTQTEIYDMASGTSLGNLEKFEISRRGKAYRATDVNVWGVTFPASGSTFYATIMTGGKRYLAEGRVDRRTIAMVDVAAECPSLSPSGKLLAYKSATSSTTWEVRVRRLADGSEAVVRTSRSVDDQIEWLDDDHVLFGLAPPGGGPTADVWVAPADGSRPAELLIRGAWSPAVVR